MSTYEEDLRIIEAATPGPWNHEVDEDTPDGYPIDVVKDGEYFIATMHDYANGVDGDINAAFIAHFNPVKVRELVEENQRKDERIAELEANNARLRNGGFNNSINAAKEALRYLASNKRPSGGNERFNSEHLLQIAKELERSFEETPADSLAAVRCDAKVEMREKIAGELESVGPPEYAQHVRCVPIGDICDD